jgi:ubiquinone/menaquinone biosynthesis C-methylase UbiE
MIPSQQNPSPSNLEQAEIYDAYLVPAIFAAAAGVLLAYVEPKTGERVLDVGCGTGVVARHAAARVGNQGSVTGLDIDPYMLAVARQIPPPTGAPIFWREGDVHALPFADRSFDLVLCQHGLQYFDDPVRAKTEMRRVLVPDGRLAVSIFGPLSDNLFYQIFDQHVIHRLGESLFSTAYSFGGEKRLKSVLAAAGCSDVEVGRRMHTIGFPNARILVQMSLLGTSTVLKLRKLSQRELRNVIDALKIWPK